MINVAVTVVMFLLCLASLSLLAAAVVIDIGVLIVLDSMCLVLVWCLESWGCLLTIRMVMPFIRNLVVWMWWVALVRKVILDVFVYLGVSALQPSFMLFSFVVDRSVLYVVRVVMLLLERLVSLVGLLVKRSLVYYTGMLLMSWRMLALMFICTMVGFGSW